MCRACGHPIETTVHLLTDECAGTSSYRAHHGISVETLVSETPADILRIAQFDAWIRQTFPFDQPIRDFGLRGLLATTLKKRRLPQSATSEDDVTALRSKRRRKLLVVPHQGLPTPPSSAHRKRKKFERKNTAEKQHAVKRSKKVG